MNKIKPPKISCILGGFMNIYIKEINSPVELINLRRAVKKINFKKNNNIKKWIRNFIKIIIRLNYEFFYYTGNVKIKIVKEHILCLIPVKYSKKNKTLIYKCTKKLNCILKQESIDNIIISENLKHINIINRSLVNNDEVEGKKLLKIMINEVIRYICNIKNEKIENKTIFILVNEYSKSNLEFIEQLACYVKNINIITNNLKKFLIFSNKYYEKNGIMMTVSNNKRKSLNRAELIINVDFLKENLIKYNINRTSIFINLAKGKIQNLKGFSGIIINGLKIRDTVKKEAYFIKDYKEFNKTVLYESTILNNISFYEIKEKIKQDNVEIQDLIGIKGILNKDEYIKIT